MRAGSVVIIRAWRGAGQTGPGVRNPQPREIDPNPNRNYNNDFTPLMRRWVQIRHAISVLGHWAVSGMHVETS